MDVRGHIKLLADIIIKKFKVKKIILFGSYAYGVSDKDSDIDLCIIANIKDKRKLDIIRDIRRETISFVSYPLDILVYNEKEFNERAKLSNTLEYKIMNEGKKIYG